MDGEAPPELGRYRSRSQEGYLKAHCDGCVCWVHLANAALRMLLSAAKNHNRENERSHVGNDRVLGADIDSYRQRHFESQGVGE